MLDSKSDSKKTHNNIIAMRFLVFNNVKYSIKKIFVPQYQNVIST